MVNSIIWGASIPLVINAATFFITRKLVGKNPEDVLKANMVGFIFRLFLYAIITGVVATKIELKLLPFFISFFLIFIFLILMEALYFLRLFYRTNK